MKEPCGTLVKALIWVISLETGIIAYYLTGYWWTVLIGVIAGIPLWIIAETSVGYYKVGITNDIHDRITAVNNGNAREIYYVSYKMKSDAAAVENKIHKEFDCKRQDGEWFSLWFWQVWIMRLKYFMTES